MSGKVSKSTSIVDEENTDPVHVITDPRSITDHRKLIELANKNTYVNPKPFLYKLIGKVIRVKLIWGMEYIGQLKYADAYINLALENVYEFINESCQGYLPNLVIRCSSILYVREFPGLLEFLPEAERKKKHHNKQKKKNHKNIN